MGPARKLAGPFFYNKDCSMSWLEGRASNLMINWLEMTSVALCATTPAGDVLWCNEAFEELTGYTSYELMQGHKDWSELTDTSEDREAEQANLEKVLRGGRDDFMITKSIRKKDGQLANVLAHTIRFPPDGEVQCLLVSCVEQNSSDRLQAKTISEVHSMMFKIIEENQNRLSLSDRLLAWVEANQWKAGIVGCVIAAFVFGDSFLHALTGVLDAFRGLPTPPAG